MIQVSSEYMATPAAETSEPAHWSRAAIASPILGVLGFATLWLIVGLFLAAAGAICGHLARETTKDGQWKGRRLATVGVTLNYASMIFFPILLLIISASFPALDMWKSEQGESQRMESQAHAAKLYVACEAYARANRGRYPASWEELSGKFIAGPELRKNLRSVYPKGKSNAFELVPHDRPVLPAFSDSVIVIQEIAPPDVEKISVVYADGTVKSIHNPDYERP